jgi:Ca-activated chloride channel homolog
MKRVLVFVLIFAVACATPSPLGHVAVRPGPTGIEGHVLNGGAHLPGATITITRDDGFIRAVVSDGDGRFAIGGIEPGRYVVRVDLAGLQSVTRILTIAAGTVTSIPFELRNAAVSESITVTAEAPMFVQDSTTETSISLATPVSTSPSSHSLYVPAPTVVPERPQYATFDDHGFVDTGKQRLTTFAIDVDRASYANIRRFLSSGTMPPRDAVRIEEMVNYFAYDYPQPTDHHPFSITTEVAGCPWNAASRLVRIGIQGRNLDEWKMAPNNLVFLLDVSGSMSPPNRLPLIQQAFRVLVDKLRAEDRVAIVVYAGREALVLPPTSGADKQAILGALGALHSGGSTAGAAGIELAYDVAQQSFIKGGNNRVILATDGDFNVGVSGIPALQKLIEKKRESGVFLSTIGVGDDNYQDAVMETLADKGNGNYNYLDTLAEAEKVFGRELTGTLVTIARDVKVQIDFDPGRVASYRQIGYENRAMANEDFRDDTKDAGELGAGHSVTALYEIVPRGSMGGTIGTIALRYKEPQGAVGTELAVSLVDEGKSVFEASADLQFAAAVAEMGMLLRDSPHKGTSSWDEVHHLTALSRGADLDGTRGEFARLAKSAQLKTSGDRVSMAR